MKETLASRAVRGLEQIVFAHRGVLVGVFCLATALFAWEATHAHLESGLDKQAPADHPYVQTSARYGGKFGGGTEVLIGLQAKDGTIFTPRFFDEFAKMADDVFYLPGIDRGNLLHMFSPGANTLEVTEEGFHSERVIPYDFKPTPEGFARVKANLLKGNYVGQLVSNDYETALIRAPLVKFNPATGKPLDYIDFAHQLDAKIKAKYEAIDPNVQVRITGLVWAAGEFANGAAWVPVFFLITLVLTRILLYRVCYQWWLATAPMLCSLAAVTWQIGLVTWLGYGIDLYSILIPFLIMAIGDSHGVQMILSTSQLVASGDTPKEAARQSFRRLFLPGAVALLTGVITFLTITTIDIPVIREFAVVATVGIGALAFTNLIWLPLLLSYARITPQNVAKLRAGALGRERFWHLLAILVQPRYAVMLSLATLVLAGGAAMAAQSLVFGDLNPGTPDLRPTSRFNRDTIFLLDHFGSGVDLLTVYATAPALGCLTKSTDDAIDDFVQAMRYVPGVHGTISLPFVMKITNETLNEGNIRWKVIEHDRHVLGDSSGGGLGFRSLADLDCSVMPVYLFLSDHKAATLKGVTQAVEAYRRAHPDLPVTLELAGGNGGQAAASNEAVEAAQIPMMILVYLAMAVICGLTFRSARAVICIIVPLALVSLIVNAAMALMGIGLKVSTLPVAALGVGIGVDYGIYKFSRLNHYLRTGMSLNAAYIQTLRETGSAVIFTGLNLSLGVATWVFSPLQFQADMGLLLTLMFFMNMVGAIILLPALIGIMQMVRPQRTESMEPLSLPERA